MAESDPPSPESTSEAAYVASCEAAGREVASLAAAADGVDPAMPVPACPGWTVADLLVHVGEIHRWTARMVNERAPARLPREKVSWAVPDEPAELASWIAAGRRPLLEAFATADGSEPMWAWGADQHVRFWPRRMTHETAVHRADLEMAVRRQPRLDAIQAADAFDELLDNLPCAAYFAPRVTELRGHGERLSFVAADAGVAWHIELVADGFTWRRTAADEVGQARHLDHVGEDDDGVDRRRRLGAPRPPTVTIRIERLADLVLVVYGRLPLDAAGIDVTGDEVLARHWLRCSAI